jgi:SAM-dependent methyltransferase
MHKNFLAYDNYEVFNNKIEEDVYRHSKLKSCDEQVNFVKKKAKKDKIVFLELGSGNSKMLFNLEKNKILDVGYGIEFSKSRFDFSQKWKEDCDIKNVFNFNHDFLEFDYESIKKVDLVFCVDLAFQFCEPIKKGSDVYLLNKIYNQINEGGLIILELDGCSNIIDTIPFSNKIWEEFPETDPWRFSLWNCKYENSLLEWDKIFIGRKGEISETKITLKIYNKEEICQLLKNIGFININLYSNWTMDKFENDKHSFIITGEKK